MIYLYQTFDIHPASYQTRDRFIALAQDTLIPEWTEHGVRLMGAWFNHARWFSQLGHLLEFDDLTHFERFATQARPNEAWNEAWTQIEAMAPQRADLLLEPLGPILPQRLHDAIRRSKDEPAGQHTFAILQLAPGARAKFIEMLQAQAGRVPIVASWRHVAGNPNEVIDLWLGSPVPPRYVPASDAMNTLFDVLRALAPEERIVTLYPLPYSPLQ